jgi:hypothetical protein
LIAAASAACSTVQWKYLHRGWDLRIGVHELELEKGLNEDESSRGGRVGACLYHEARLSLPNRRPLLEVVLHKVE